MNEAFQVLPLHCTFVPFIYITWTLAGAALLRCQTLETDCRCYFLKDFFTTSQFLFGIENAVIVIITVLED
jgi:hypothetical protein